MRPISVSSRCQNMTSTGLTKGCLLKYTPLMSSCTALKIASMLLKTIQLCHSLYSGNILAYLSTIFSHSKWTVNHTGTLS